jgi:AcrR family transcriptional regulator
LIVCWRRGTLVGVAAPATNSRTQAQRSQDTRERLMRATIDCLVERGWSGTTTTEVAERAGVSRGAQLHHYRTRSDLVVAAVEHLGRQRVAEIRRVAADLPRDDRRTEAVLEMLAGLYTGAPFLAALELWVAARTDPELLAVVAPLEARFGREAHRLTVSLLGADESRPGVREAIQSTLDFVRGLGLADVLTDDEARRARLLRSWAKNLEEALR